MWMHDTYWPITTHDQILTTFTASNLWNMTGWNFRLFEETDPTINGYGDDWGSLIRDLHPKFKSPLVHIHTWWVQLLINKQLSRISVSEITLHLNGLDLSVMSGLKHNKTPNIAFQNNYNNAPA